MAAGPVTELQKSDALEQAAACARSLGDFERATELAGAIPIEAVARSVRMQNLLAMRKPAELVEMFSDEEILRWPFWKVGEGLVLRGRAFARIGRGREAEADLVQALPFTTDPRARMALWLVLGENRENNLKDVPGALEAYRQIAASSKGTGSATYYRGVLGAARILRRQGKVPEALVVLRKVDIARLRGYWHGSMLVALGDTLAAGGRKEEALTAYREVLKDKGAGASDRESALKAIEAITTDR
jgi:tetratricopeptide (TPR) repeat protein